MQETQRREWETSLRENSFWVAQLARTARDDSDPTAVLRFPDRVDALTADAIREAAVRYLDRNEYVRISLRPETGG